MKKYDYVLVGSGLFSGAFAYLARKQGKHAWSWKNVIPLVEICIVRIWKIFMFISMVPIFSIPAIKKYGSL